MDEIVRKAPRDTSTQEVRLQVEAEKVQSVYL